jgi:hypothetical protein
MTSRRRSSAETPAAGRAQRILAAANFERWQRLGRTVRNLLNPASFQRGLDERVAAWPAEEQAVWLGAALAAAPRSPRAGIAIYRETPPALAPLPAAMRRRLLPLLAAAAESAEPDEIETLVPVLGALLAEVPRERRAEFLDVGESVARACPAAVPGLLRCLPRVMEEAPPERVADWTARGLALAPESPDAARVYFALQSRTSLRALQASPTAARLEELQSVRHRYIQMLSGAPASVRSTAPFRLRPPLEDDPSAGGVALPGSIDVLGTWEDNARIYRVLAAFLAARREFGTYHDPTLLARLRDGAAAALAEWFLLTEGYRIARRLACAYPGIGADLEWAGGALLRQWSRARPAASQVLDALLAHALAPRAPLPPWLAGLAAVALPCLTPLDDPGATAATALAVAELLRTLLSLEADAGEGAPPLLLSAELYLGADDDGALPGGETGMSADGDSETSPADRPATKRLPADVLAELQLRLGRLAEETAAAGRALTAEELRRLLEAGIVPELAQAEGTAAPEAGLYVTQLIGKLLVKKDTAKESRAALERRRLLAPRAAVEGAVFVYDEWDHVIADYRHGWCALREVDLGDDGGLFFTRTLERYAPLVPEIRRHFQRVRPESFRTLRGLEDGENFDLNAVIDARAERRARRSPSPKLYIARARLEREVATLFLLDMSASTDEAPPGAGPGRRIIDIEKEALVIMAAALEEIGDAFAIYGFSGQGRHNVEFYPVKDFGERLAAGAKGRIGGIQPRGSTRMGTALRHAVGKMRDVRAPNRYLILISDGFPQDLDYGDDRRSHAYGIGDTAVALREVETAGIKPFCITVDVAGHDYLRRMSDPLRYMIIENVEDLPRELPKIYQRLVRAA